jgi:4'-phosphopantetheinyl transferase
VQPNVAWLVHLDNEERRKAQALTVERVRSVFVTSRAVQRLIGSRYLGIPPGEVVITRDCLYCASRSHGRPRFAGATVDYSVSHTEQWVVIALVGSGTTGVDIEDAAARTDTDRLAHITLTASEKREFAQLPEAARGRRFFSAWTRKEAVMKLTGLGLRAAPNQLDVSGPLLTAGVVPDWTVIPVHLYHLPAPAGHVAALASSVPVTALRAGRLGGSRGTDV